MKSKQLTFSLQKKSLLLVLGLCACFSTIQVLANDHPGKLKTTAYLFEDDKKPAKKTRSSAKTTVNTVSVRFVPDIFKKSFHVVTKSESEKEMNFFVFDVEGNLVMNYKSKGSERKTISGLNRGNYIYRVFCDDEEVASGRIQFR
jgi:hypothetical protein